MSDMSLLACGVTLSISCVTYASHKQILSNTIASLAVACAYAQQQGQLQSASLTLIDNGPDDNNRINIECLAQQYAHAFAAVKIKTGHGNIGYGCGHNLAIALANSDYHLVLNPDVILDKESLSIALTYMANNSDVGLLAPDAVGENGERQYLAKRMPHFSVLVARALNCSWLNKKLKVLLDRYEYRDLIPAAQPIQIELASGCFMLFRGVVLRRVEGFNPAYFMYFEDFDLSDRVARVAQVVHHPGVKIVHYGGGAARKGLKHIIYFFVSYFKFSLKSK